MSKGKKTVAVSIVIPNFNGEKLLLKNLPFVIKASKNLDNKIKEIIVVDDSSTDKSVEIIKREFPEVRLIQHRINRGFSAAVNTGVRTAKSDLVCLLNTDVLPTENFLVNAITHFKDPKVFAVSLSEKGFSWARGYFKDGFVEHEPGPATQKPHTTFWVSGGSGVFRRDYWMKLKGMDEKLFSPFYWEDVDLSYRAAKRGWKLLWEPKSKVLHEHEATIGKLPIDKKRTIQERNQLIFIWKNVTSPNLFKKHLIGLVKRVARHPGYARIVLLALLKAKYILAERKKEKNQSKVSDEAVFARFSK